MFLLTVRIAENGFSIERVSHNDRLFICARIPEVLLKVDELLQEEIKRMEESWGRIGVEKKEAK